MTRREFPAKVKAKAFERCGGNCEVCGVRLSVGKFRYDHKLPDWLGGEPTLENCVVQCVACDAPKTAQDISRIAKTKRQHAAHIGAKAPSRNPMPCGKNSRFKKKVNGQIVPRDT